MSAKRRVQVRPGIDKDGLFYYIMGNNPERLELAGYVQDHTYLCENTDGLYFDTHPLGVLVKFVSLSKAIECARLQVDNHFDFKDWLG